MFVSQLTEQSLSHRVVGNDQLTDVHNYALQLTATLYCKQDKTFWNFISTGAKRTPVVKLINDTDYVTLSNLSSNAHRATHVTEGGRSGPPDNRPAVQKYRIAVTYKKI